MKLILDEENLWSQVIHQKYKIKGINNLMRKISNSSWAWWALRHVASCVADRVVWKTGNGADKSVFRDNWLDIYPLSEWPTYHNSGKVDLDWRVSHLIGVNGWSDGNLHQLFHNCLVDRFKFLPITVAGMWCCGREGTGYSVKEAYELRAE